MWIYFSCFWQFVSIDQLPHCGIFLVYFYPNPRAFWGSEFFMEFPLILLVLALMRQSIGSASGVDLIYIVNVIQKTSRVIDFNNFQQPSIGTKISGIVYHFQIITILYHYINEGSSLLHHVLVFFFLCIFCVPVSTWKTFTEMMHRQ